MSRITIMMKTAMAMRPPITPPAIAPIRVFALVADEAPLGALLLLALLLAALVEEVVVLIGIL
jgi:hypothetical protein